MSTVYCLEPKSCGDEATGRPESLTVLHKISLHISYISRLFSLLDKCVKSESVKVYRYWRKESIAIRADMYILNH